VKDRLRDREGDGVDEGGVSDVGIGMFYVARESMLASEFTQKRAGADKSCWPFFGSMCG